MKWRCTQCGRPAETNGEPCRDCGSESFEQAVVRMTKRCTTCGEPAAEYESTCRECGFGTFEPLDQGPTAAELQGSYVEFRCTECGNEHPRNTPPCDRCGNMTLEPVQVDDVDVEDYLEGSGGGALGARDVAIALAVLLGLAALWGCGNLVWLPC